MFGLEKFRFFYVYNGEEPQRQKRTIVLGIIKSIVDFDTPILIAIVFVIFLVDTSLKFVTRVKIYIGWKIKAEKVLPA